MSLEQKRYCLLACCVCLQAVLSSGKLYLATSTAVLDLATPAYSRRPSIAWAELSVSSEVTGADSCPQSQAGARARDAFDWLTDYSWNWGAEVRHSNMLLRSCAACRGPAAHTSSGIANGQLFAASWPAR